MNEDFEKYLGHRIIAFLLSAICMKCLSDIMYSWYQTYGYDVGESTTLIIVLLSFILLHGYTDDFMDKLNRDNENRKG